MTREKLWLFCALLANWALVIGIRLHNVTIPQYGTKDSSVTLSCYFDLEQDKLLSLKWYKNGHEFFRYSLQTGPSIKTFPVDGVYVETQQSNMNQVVLKNVSLSTSGAYKCEVSADRPSFRTLSHQGDLIIVVPPKGLPRIQCIPELIHPGDTLNCTCSSYASKPAASLMFYLNDGKANFGDMVEYLPISEAHSLETSSLGLVFVLEPAHLRNGLLRVKCTATFGNGYWVSNITLREGSVNVNAQPSSPGHNRLLSGGSRGNGTGGLLTFFLTLLGLSLARVVLVLPQELLRPVARAATSL